MQEKLIFRGDVAKYLLKKGYQIVDVKAKKENPTSTIFVFKMEDGLMEILKSRAWKKEI